MAEVDQGLGYEEMRVLNRLLSQGPATLPEIANEQGWRQRRARKVMQGLEKRDLTNEAGGVWWITPSGMVTMRGTS